MNIKKLFYQIQTDRILCNKKPALKAGFLNFSFRAFVELNRSISFLANVVAHS